MEVIIANIPTLHCVLVGYKKKLLKGTVVLFDFFLIFCLYIFCFYATFINNYEKNVFYILHNSLLDITCRPTAYVDSTQQVVDPLSNRAPQHE